MKRRELYWRIGYYGVELAILILGYSLILFFSFDFSVQVMFLIITLMFYIAFGVLRHQAEHDLKAKVVIEYILISVLIVIAFLFLNIGRI